MKKLNLILSSLIFILFFTIETNSSSDFKKIIKGSAKIIDGANAGLTCPSESPDLLAKNIQKLSLMQKLFVIRIGPFYQDYGRGVERHPNLLVIRLPVLALDVSSPSVN